MRRRPGLIATSGALSLMLALQLLALALIRPFDEAGYEPVDDPTNPIYGVLFLVVILVATGLMLIAFKHDLQTLIRGAIIAIAGLLTWYVAAALTPIYVMISVAGLAFDIISIMFAIGVVVALLFYPEWYVIDLTALIIGAGAAALFGISFSILPILILLVVLAVYDAISVYGTKHMLTLAEGAMTMRIPVLLVIPLSLEFTTERLVEPTEDATDSGDQTDQVGATEMDAIFLGLGDLVIPSILIISAAGQGLGDTVITFLGLGLGFEVLGAMLGSLIGLAVLIWMVFQGRAHAGLPVLNGGVIIGYLTGAIVAGIGLSAAIGF